MDVGDLKAGWRKVLVTAVPLDSRELRQGWHRTLNRIPPSLGIGDVALNAVDAQDAGQRSTSSVLERVAELHSRSRLADEAGVDPFPARLKLAHDGRRAVDAGTFLIRREQHRQGPVMVWFTSREALGGCDQCGD